MKEFERISRFFAPLCKDPATSRGLEDDIALISNGQWVITTDTLVETIHYIGDEPAGLIAKKLLRCNISDLAAKGAKPCYYTLNLTLTDRHDEQWLTEFSQGLKEDQELYGLELIGGDSTKTKEGHAVLSATLFGQANIKTPSRSGSTPGDVLCVSGTIGDAAIGLKYVLGELEIADDKAAAYFTRRYQLPEPRTVLGRSIAADASASMDVSDGLLQDAGHIAKRSAVSIQIYADKLPLSEAATALLSSPSISVSDIMTGGDDYEILCSMSRKQAESYGDALTIIGDITQGQGVCVLDEKGGKDITPTQKGYQHF